MAWKTMAWKMMALLAAIAASVSAGPKVNLGRAVSASERVAMDQIDHSAWDQLLQKYVNDGGQVDYRRWKANVADVQALDGYLAELSRGDLSANAPRESQLAFWINAYNAVTVKGILREYPTSSIRNHTAKLVGYNIWKDLLINIGGTAKSLEAIEHEVLRPMGEPRIHFAIVCASISCPRLLNRAYSADRLEMQLQANTAAFFANANNFEHNLSQRTFKLSAILDWFGSDFGKGQAAQLKAIAPYLPTQEARDAAEGNAVRVSYLKYDWGLNEQTEPVGGPGP